MGLSRKLLLLFGSVQRALVCKKMIAGFDHAGTSQDVLASSKRPRNTILKSSQIFSGDKKCSGSHLDQGTRSDGGNQRQARIEDCFSVWSCSWWSIAMGFAFHPIDTDISDTHRNAILQTPAGWPSWHTYIIFIETKTAGPPCDQLTTSSSSSCSSLTSPWSSNSRSEPSSISSCVSSSAPNTLVAVSFAFAFAFPFALVRAFGLALASKLLFSAAWPHAS